MRNEKLRDFYSSPDITVGMKWTEHVAGKGQMSNSQKITRETDYLKTYRPGYRYKDSTETYFKIGGEGGREPDSHD